MTCLYLASASWRAALTSAATLPAVRPAPDVRSDTSWRSACKVKRASPITACARGIHLVDVQLVDVAVDDGLLRRIRNGVAEAARRQARADGEDEVAVVQVVCHLIAAHADKQ